MLPLMERALVVQGLNFAKCFFTLQTLHIPLHLKSMDGKIVSSPTSIIFQPGFPVSEYQLSSSVECH